jgi:hypothetical protein
MVALVLAGYYVQKRFRRDDTSMHPGFLVCLGLSLAFKHAFVLFPLWLALRPASLRERARILIVPYAVWIVFALYYLFPNPTYFIHNVLSYGGWSGNALIPFWTWWSATHLHIAGSDLRKAWLPLLLLAMAIIGWRIRRWSLERALLLYPIALLVFASTVALQYFNLASFSIAASLDLTGVLFSVFAAYFYFGYPEELNLWTLPPWLQNSWIRWSHPTNVGWWICQAFMVVLLVRRLLRWSRDEKAGASAVGTPESSPALKEETATI